MSNMSVKILKHTLKDAEFSKKSDTAVKRQVDLFFGFLTVAVEQRSSCFLFRFSITKSSKKQICQISRASNRLLNGIRTNSFDGI